MAEDADIAISRQEPDTLILDVRSRADSSVEALCEQLRAALVDFGIRVDVERRTSEIRNLIWRTAFSEASPRS
jgi:His-Xaa-Ser system protein HxsD